MTRPLREGFTTGTAAAAAAKAAALWLATGAAPARMDTPLPPGGRLMVPVAAVLPEGGGARARVIKDGGDDPDATHGRAVEAVVTLDPDGRPGAVELLGGRGVGRVTLPGLPVPPGEPAINPAPRAQIRRAVAEALDAARFRGAARVTVEVPDGEEIAAKTMNARLGIVGGVSILGTRGTVRPFSHESWAATVLQGLDVARAQGLDHAALATGGRTEALLRADLPGLPPLAFVQFADFFALALSGAAERGFARVTVGCYFGKLVKMAQGHEYTHAHTAALDFDALARWCAGAGLAPGAVAAVRRAVTARHVLEMVLADPAKDAIIAQVAARALAAARRHAGGPARPIPAIALRVYAFDGGLLCAIQGESGP